MPPSLTIAVVLAVRDDDCTVRTDNGDRTVRFAPMFPGPRRERISPGHLVAVAGRGGRDAVVWRWYDAVVLGADGELVRLWVPAHGEVSARRRPTYVTRPPGTRAYASAGLPGAPWWVAGPVVDQPAAARVELVDLAAFYAEHWDSVFATD